jgi:internalin A
MSVVLDAVLLQTLRDREPKMTQAELAAKAGVGKRSVERAEDGKAVSPIIAGKIAKALGVTLESLVRVENKFDAALANYYASVRKHCGKLFYGNLADTWDEIEIDLPKLYVLPNFSDRAISPESDDIERDTWSFDELIKRLVELRWLVVLGDPGFGKTVLTSMLAYWLASQPANPQLYAALPGVVPVLFACRELEIPREGPFTFAKLLDQLRNTSLGKKLASVKDFEPVMAAIAAGKALLIFDGLDEVSDVEKRKQLHKAVVEGVKETTNLVLATSRIAGYEEANFTLLRSDTKIKLHEYDERFNNALLASASIAAVYNGHQYISYTAPFSDPQLHQFAQHWYAQRYPHSPKEANERAADLVEAVHKDANVLRLARVPNLLTLIALIHRQDADLPEGKVALYQRIADAYLERIDNFRKIQTRRDSLTDKKRWLAAVAFHMQSERKDEDDERGLMISRTELIKVLSDAMTEWGVAPLSDDVESFIAYLERRTGLLIERKPGWFAFVHLSFQEFFAAWHLHLLIVGRETFDDASAILKRRVEETTWLETLLFLLGIENSERANFMVTCEALFGTKWKAGLSEDSRPKEAMVLLARLVRDPKCGLPEPVRINAIRACCRWEIKSGPISKESFEKADVFALLLGGFETQEAIVLTELVTAYGQEQSTILNLRSTNITNLQPLAPLTALTTLDLSRCPGVTNLQPLAPLTALTTLNLTECTGVTNLQPLAPLAALTTLDLTGCTGVTNLQPLPMGLKWLYLSNDMNVDVERFRAERPGLNIINL